MRDRDAVTLHPSGHIESPGDLHVSPDVRVAFSRFAGLTSAAYSDDNAILMKLVDAETGEAFAAGAPPPTGKVRWHFASRYRLAAPTEPRTGPSCCHGRTKATSTSS